MHRAAFHIQDPLSGTLLAISEAQTEHGTIVQRESLEKWHVRKASCMFNTAAIDGNPVQYVFMTVIMKKKLYMNSWLSL